MFESTVIKPILRNLYGEWRAILSHKERCRKVGASFLISLIRHAKFRLRGKTIFASNGVKIRGLDNISIKKSLHIGMNYVGFMNSTDLTYLNIAGKLHFNGEFVMGKGCRFDVEKNAVAEFGNGHITANTTFVIMHGLKVGNGCVISWGCQFLDEDFHEIHYAGKKEKTHPIEIGDHVWIGSNVTVLKGAKIPDGCVIASGSVVKSKFEIKNALLAGNPAKVIKEEISWS